MTTISAPLTMRQAEVLEMLRQGLSAAEIAPLLFITPRTVTWHREQILYRSGSRNTREALAYYYSSALRPEFAPRRYTWRNK